MPEESIFPAKRGAQKEWITSSELTSKRIGTLTGKRASLAATLLIGMNFSSPFSKICHPNIQIPTTTGVR